MKIEKSKLVDTLVEISTKNYKEGLKAGLDMAADIIVEMIETGIVKDLAELKTALMGAWKE